MSGDWEGPLLTGDFRPKYPDYTLVCISCSTNQPSRQSLASLLGCLSHTRRLPIRKKFLIGFGFTGAAASMSFIAVGPRIYLLGSLLVIIGVTCLGSSFVLLNSFLPVLVANHPGTKPSGLFDDPGSPTRSLGPLSPGLRHRDSAEYPMSHSIVESSKRVSHDSSDLNLSTKISSKGVGLGYVAAVFVQVLSILLLFVMSKISVSSTLPLRLVLFLVGAWWFAFTIPSSMYLRSRPGPPLRAVIGGGRWQSCLAYISFAWISLYRTLKVAIQLRQAVIFLVAWFLLSDAIATISGTAILFARTELQMSTVAIALLSITATSAGIAGAFVWPILSHRFALKTNQVIVACIVMMEVIPLYGLLGYVPFIKSWGVGGLQQTWEIYPLGFLLGFVMGGLSSYCRSFFGLLIPPGSEAAFYALYAITDKGSSAFGPAIVGAIVDRTGQIRPAFGFLAILIALPAPLILFVDAEKGQTDAVRMAAALHKTNDGRQTGQGDLELQGDDSTHEAAGLMRDHD